MQFYKFEGVIKEDLTKTEAAQDNRRMINYRNRKIALKSDEFSEKLQNRACFFISNMVNGMGSIIMKDTINIERQLDTCLNAVDISLTEYHWDEITFYTLQNMLSAADRDCSVNDDYEILEQILNLRDIFTINELLRCPAYEHNPGMP